MTKVCVIGGGTAGVEAAAEAAKGGAQVTLLERTSTPPLPRSLWPRLLQGEEPRPRRHQALGPLGVDVRLGLGATAIGPSGRVSASGSSARFESIIVACGSSARAPGFVGSRKRGVYILAESTDYLELGASLGSVERCVVSGQGMAPLEVADRLTRMGRSVIVLGRGTTTAGLSRTVRELLEVAAAEAGVKISGSRLQKAAGVGSIEAVVASARTIPCDALVVVPLRSPSYPAGVPRLGPNGGVLVKGDMSSTEPGVYAAGSCAEMANPEGSPAIPLGGSSAASGRVAGASSTGRRTFLRRSGSFSAELFGMWAEGAGVTLIGAQRAGLDAVETENTEGAAWACSLVHQRATGVILGVQLAGPLSRGMSGLAAMLVSQRLDLGTLAYGDIGLSTDISLLQDTARQGLAWS